MICQDTHRAHSLQADGCMCSGLIAKAPSNGSSSIGDSFLVATGESYLARFANRGQKSPTGDVVMASRVIHKHLVSANQSAVPHDLANA